MTTRTENQIDHIALVVDASGSMSHLSRDVIKVVDNQIAYLASRSKDLNREVRVSVYTFDDTVKCVIFDKDVLRMPSIRDLYRIGGMTALIEATMKSQEDLATTSTIYGDHAFLTYVITDGAENASRRRNPGQMRSMLAGLADNATLATLVPDHQAVDRAVRLGFPADNIEVWDASSTAGLVAAGSRIQQATDAWMDNRSRGIRSTKTLFSTGPEVLNKATVTATLTPLPMDKYSLIPVMPDGVQKGDKVRVDKFIREDCGMQFKLGTVYYEWSKKETVQPQKRLAVVQKSTGKVFVGTGDEVRQMIGLPSLNTREAPKANPDFTVFVQSTAPNRNLVPFTKVLVML
jgi:hypothetical protein